MSRPESVSSRIASCRVEDRHLEDLVALLLAAGEALVDGAVEEGLLHLDELRLLVEEREEVDRVELGLPAVLAHGVDRGAQEVRVRDARDLHGILEREEHALARAHLGRHGEKVHALEPGGALRHDVAGPPRQDVRERALARPVRAHDRVHLARADDEVDPLEDLVPVFLDGSVKIRDFEKIHPTDPSSETPSSFCASTANSIGSSLRTRLAKPLTMSETASSAERPRWRQ